MTTKRTIGIGVGIVALAAAIGFWQCSRGDKPAASARTGSAASGSGAGASAAARWTKPKADPKTLARASVAGTIRNEEGAPIPGARVCALVYTNKISQELLPDPFCTTSDANGGYVIKDLFADQLSVTAMAKPYQPGAYQPTTDSRREIQFDLAPGEAKTGVDIVLRKGGVEITGTVSDLTGGPIANALVTARAGWQDHVGTPAVETDAKGTFSLWVRPGDVNVEASAEGYASGSEQGKAPGTFDVLLTPEGTLAGVVVDAASGTPVAGVPVSVGDSRWGGEKSDITDDQGKFRVTRLEPGRYTVFARGPQGYGRSDGSSLVALGQHVDGVVVKLHPGFRISGTVVLPDKTTCKKSWLGLHDKEREAYVRTDREPDGTVVAHGVLPGTYTVSIGCEGFDSRDKYEPITVVDKDLDGLTWEVDAGVILRGRVLTKAGTPIERASVWGQSTGGDVRAKDGWLSDMTRPDGVYEMKGVRPGAYKLEVNADRGVGPEDGWKVDVKPTGVTEQDLVLDEGGSIKGVVVDAAGKPLPSITVRAYPMTGAMIYRGFDSGVRTGADGTFQLDDLRPAQYRVYAMRGSWSNDLRKPGTTDDDKQGEKVTVVANQAATVKLVVEAPTGVIKGTVVDSAGVPVADAFVVAARESDAAGAAGSSVSRTRWSWDERPVLTNTDGMFSVGELAPGKYTIRAHRKGGGEAVAEHVAVGTTTKLQIKATGTITGIAKREGGVPEDLQLHVTDAKTGFSRNESFFRAGGAFAIRDLPAGTFTITATSEGGKKQVTVTLAEGEQKAGVMIELEPLVEITGRIVDRVSKAPVPGMRMSASSGKNAGFMYGGMNEDEDQLNISGTDGRFTIKRAPRGDVTLRGFSKDFQDSEYGFITAMRTVTGTGTVDIGDITVLKKRLEKGEQAGDLGINFKQMPPGTPLDERVYEVSFIDPKGPAAKADIKVGDVVIAIDGVSITGPGVTDAWILMRAPVGTKLELGLARGVTVPITLAQPD